jgi:DNA-directed RNA polymerase subunit RPC12/RpoP
MRFRCGSCGIEFDTIEQLAAHKRQHQSGPPDTSGVTCLGCGKKIPVEESKANYSGPLTCPSCKNTMQVVLRDGEVVTARFG